MAQEAALDPLSRRTIVGFTLRSCAFGLVVGILSNFDALPRHGAFGLSTALCVFGAAFSVARAAGRNVSFARGGLNAWDEAAAFWGGFLALHLVQGLWK